jgi:site-specific DNA-methyltransferase (cytosine-N4-specific)
LKKLPTYLDRYPAKMVSRLAATLVSKFAEGAETVFDPFCGSGAVLMEAANRGIAAHGMDLNPYGILLSKIKIEGFDSSHAQELWLEVRKRTTERTPLFPVRWDGKNYWFTPATLNKYEKLRSVLDRLRVDRTQAGRALLLAFALSVRRCSRADQRSPKPFISNTAREKRGGRHFDPLVEITLLLEKLSFLYGKKTGRKATLHFDNVICPRAAIGRHSHVITSPPYINAQDYFRNFKLELHMLAGLLDFSVAQIKEQFIGTERGNVLAGIPEVTLEKNRRLYPRIAIMRQTNPRAAAIVDRYFWDMARSIQNITKILNPGGTFVLVCGDNLVAGQRIPTWRILNLMAEQSGFVLRDQFGDKIECRAVPPKRNGHKGLIKQEVVSAFVKADASREMHA